MTEGVIKKKINVTKPKTLIKVPRGKVAIITNYIIERKGIKIEYDWEKAGDGEIAYDGWKGPRIFQVPTWEGHDLVTDLYFQKHVDLMIFNSCPNLRGKNIVYRGWGCTDALETKEDYDRSSGLVKEKNCDVTITLSYKII